MPLLEKLLLDCHNITIFLIRNINKEICMFERYI